MRAAIWQSTTGIDAAENAVMLVDAVARAGHAGADMLFTPEMVGYLDRDRARAAQNLRSEREDVVLAAARNAAAKHGIWVHIGSLGLRDERSDGRWVNRSFM
ncbi:MAG: nitrilase-related carbon-nitrogen hydrolase, partial [Sphingobium sp.]